LSIDDFGTGYSSLSSLRRIPVDRVKIDQSFIDGLHHDTSDESLVAAIVAMASALRVTTVAEGVETYEQGKHLHELGCNVAQGNFYSRPLPAAVVPAVVENFGVSRRSHLRVVPASTLAGASRPSLRRCARGRAGAAAPAPAPDRGAARPARVPARRTGSRTSTGPRSRGGGSTRRDRSRPVGSPANRGTGAAPARRSPRTRATSRPG